MISNFESNEVTRVLLQDITHLQRIFAATNILVSNLDNIQMLAKGLFGIDLGIEQNGEGETIDDDYCYGICSQYSSKIQDLMPNGSGFLFIAHPSGSVGVYDRNRRYRLS